VLLLLPLVGLLLAARLVGERRSLQAFFPVLSFEPPPIVADRVTGDPTTNNSTAVNNESPETPRNGHDGYVTLIVQLRGELSNQLSSLAHARVTQVLAERLGIRIVLVGQHQNNAKWTRGRDDIVRCFVNLKNLTFEGGIWDPNFKESEQLQSRWLSDRDQSLLKNARRAGLQALQRLLAHPNSRMSPYSSLINQAAGNITYSVPYLTTDSFIGMSVFDYYGVLRDWLKIDDSDPACCRARAAGDETVLHVRNFVSETERSWSRGLLDLSPNNTANKLFRNKNGDNNSSSVNSGSFNKNSSNDAKVVILSRFPYTLKPYADALQATSGVSSATVLFDQTGIQDFCFLRSARTTMIGTRRSTYALWAGVLGNASTVRLYSIRRSPLPENRTEQQIEASSTYTRSPGGSNRTFLFETYYQPDKFTLPGKKTKWDNPPAWKAAAAESAQL